MGKKDLSPKERHAARHALTMAMDTAAETPEAFKHNYETFSSAHRKIGGPQTPAEKKATKAALEHAMDQHSVAPESTEDAGVSRGHLHAAYRKLGGYSA